MSLASKNNMPISKDIFDISRVLELVDGDKDLEAAIKKALSGDEK